MGHPLRNFGQKRPGQADRADLWHSLVTFRRSSKVNGLCWPSGWPTNTDLAGTLSYLMPVVHFTTSRDPPSSNFISIGMPLGAGHFLLFTKRIIMVFRGWPVLRSRKLPLYYSQCIFRQNMKPFNVEQRLRGSVLFQHGLVRWFSQNTNALL